MGLANCSEVRARFLEAARFGQGLRNAISGRLGNPAEGAGYPRVSRWSSSKRRAV